ncbi:SMP-30/gluconolactonase/LRE family protein [uncultured Rhodoferax sp.]|uniref:SMP-30/gluconolactonase/LRE family protein n=1 Tax=uncultured Rhodoferax sp. TaxID=223188 RepID=UPI0025D67A63|nr:SMP-30/gluconolactonase/LRE family protein [uncultured Rhodoferax sp.]
MKRIALCVAALLTLLVVYLLSWPVPVAPVAWQAPVDAGYTGPHAVNTRLAKLHMIDLQGEVGPEHIQFGPDGKLYTTVLSGNILRMNADGSAQQVFANTGGRVLGFDFDAKGYLIAADAMKGLLSISPEGKVAVLTDHINNDPIRYADAVVVAPSGKMYLSDASTRFAPKDWGGTFEASVLDILEQASTGRILEYDPASKTTRVVAKGISFANGVALSQDGQSLFVNETGKYRVWKIATTANNLDIGTLANQPSAQASVLLDNLPGYPDNLMRGLDGKIWLGFAKPRNPTIDKLAQTPWLRSLTLRLPRALWPIPKTYGHVMAFTEDGKVVADLQDPSGAYPETTAVTETKDRLYVQSLHAHGIGWLAR